MGNFKIGAHGNGIVLDGDYVGRYTPNIDNSSSNWVVADGGYSSGKYYAVTSTITGTSSAKIVVSVDSGVTWKAWSGSEWIIVEPTESGFESGMSPLQ